MGTSVCSTATLTRSGGFPDWVTVPYHVSQLPATITQTTDSADPFGYFYQLQSPVCLGGADKTSNPDDAAPKLCSSAGVCGVTAVGTAKFLTETSSSTENVPPPAAASPTPPPAAKTPPAAKSPPPAQESPSPDPPQSVQNKPASSVNVGANIASFIAPTSTNVGANIASFIAPPSPTITPNELPATEVSTVAPAIVVGSSTIVANSESVFVVGGQSLSAGGTVVVQGTTIAVGSAGSVAVINGVTQAVQTVTPPPPSPVLSVNGQDITANSNSAFVVGGQTLTVGGSVVVSGTTISLASKGGIAVVNGATQTLATPGSKATPEIITINGQTISANQNSVSVVAGKTLTPGSSIVVSGTTISLASTGGIAVVNGVTQTLAHPGSPTVSAFLTINGQTYTENSQSQFVVAGQTLAPGHPITVGSGSSTTVISLTTDSAGHPVVIMNGKTSTISASGSQSTSSGSISHTASNTTMTTTTGVGDIIASGVGLQNTGTSSAAGKSAATRSHGLTGYGIFSMIVSSILFAGAAL
jgi:hypothetical protein